jgi:hypothetical protein
VTNTSRLLGLSRRHVLAGLAATPALSAASPAAAQTAGPRRTPRQAQAALKHARGTKLVLLGTAAGPVPGRLRRKTSHVMLSNGSAYLLDCGMGSPTNTHAPASRSARAPVYLHHPSPRRPQYRIRPTADRRLDPGSAARHSRLRSAATQADDRGLHARLQADRRFLG